METSSEETRQGTKPETRQANERRDQGTEPRSRTSDCNWISTMAKKRKRAFGDPCLATTRLAPEPAQTANPTLNDSSSVSKTPRPYQEPAERARPLETALKLERHRGLRIKAYPTVMSQDANAPPPRDLTRHQGTQPFLCTIDHFTGGSPRNSPEEEIITIGDVG